MTSEPTRAERRRLDETERSEKDWQMWGTYLPERQWGTVREDYSIDGKSWEHFPYEMAQYRAYRWGEDGLFGWTDRECQLAFSVALWNGADPFLKERLFGLTNEEGNHGEDVKDLYYYLDATPTHSYAKALYRYPQAAFPYEHLRQENKRRGAGEGEYELLDTDVFAENRFFDVSVEYAKVDDESVCIRITVANRGPEPAGITVLPTCTFRNTWTWPNLENLGTSRPRLRRAGKCQVHAQHKILGEYMLEAIGQEAPVALLFTENETNTARYSSDRSVTGAFTKDAFDRTITQKDAEAVNPQGEGTRCAFRYELRLASGEERAIYLHLGRPRDGGGAQETDGLAPEETFRMRIAEADEFYEEVLRGVPPEQTLVARQAFAGLLWSKQFYFFAADQWFGDAGQKTASTPARLKRTEGWEHLFCKDVLMVPDKWEYPWFAAWDLCFHAVTMALIDPAFAKQQMLLLMREQYMHGNGQIPAYEFSFGDVNPPVQAWAAMRIYEMGAKGKEPGDLDFLECAFQKLVVNFTWWANRADAHGKKLFGGGFLGLDNISLFNRSVSLPDGVWLAQADGNAWVGLFAASMLEMALELAAHRPSYADVASMFADDYVKLAKGLNTLGGSGLWSEEDGFYFDQIHLPDGSQHALKLRSIVGLAPLFAVCLVRREEGLQLQETERRVKWLMDADPALHGAFRTVPSGAPDMRDHFFASFVPEDRLRRVFERLFAEAEFLSAHGLRALSRAYKDDPFQADIAGHHLTASYAAAEADDDIFGGNSNWRGPVWFPVNFLLLHALERYGRIFGETLRVEYPTGSGRFQSLLEAAADIRARLLRIFQPEADGRRPLHGNEQRYKADPLWRDILLFYEYFSGEDGHGVGASHQTGWTALAASLIVCQ